MQKPDLRGFAANDFLSTFSGNREQSATDK